MKQSLEALSCDWKVVPAKPRKGKKFNKSIIYRHKGDCNWSGIRTDKYKPEKGDWSKIIRRVLIGQGLKTKSHVRYFEIEKGGSSSFEKHRHEHIVIGIKGNGKALLGKKTHKINFLDVVYVPPNIPHQFLNPFKKPFGFLCIVPAKRDKPVLLNR
jgi:ribulose-bisphosphate carboxylase large chain